MEHSTRYRCEFSSDALPRMYSAVLMIFLSTIICITGVGASTQATDNNASPDIYMSSFDESHYLVGYDGGIVPNQGNPNQGRVDDEFFVAENAGCPFLYVTGFSFENGNANGLFTPIGPIENNAAWAGGSEHQNLYLYWKEAEEQKSPSWVLDDDLDPKNVLALPSNALSADTKDRSWRPPTGPWNKWINNNWVLQPSITFTCLQERQTAPPSLTQISPPISATRVPVDASINMTFSQDVTYGHWGVMKLVSRATQHAVTFVSDLEAGMRGKEIVSFQNREVQLHPNEFLEPGTTYDLVVVLGALTNLAYVPWGPVEEGIVYFTTFGVNCTAPPDGGSAYELSGGDSLANGAEYVVRCSEGFSSSSADASVSTVFCDDGRWSEPEIVCTEDCHPYETMGGQYKVTSVRSREITLPGRHGDELAIACGTSSMILVGASPETVVCKNGRWSDLYLRCGATCGPYPSLGRNYELETEGGVMIGATRTIRCGSRAEVISGRQPEIVKCTPTGWAPQQLQCNVPCQPYPLPGLGYSLTGSGVQHGSERIKKCQDGFGPTNVDIKSATIECTNGLWVPDQELTCKVLGTESRTIDDTHENDLDIDTGLGTDVLHNLRNSRGYPSASS